mmetsp:Transcript_66919/g.139481  ORF Transcript_66919/g.139481 Transcript_66919/m.139481 type:complete len:503 (+) Transcript_66919:158-1666(+)
MFGIDVDPNDILEGLKGVRDFEGKEDSEHTWSYQRQKDALEMFNMDILICDNVDSIFAKYRPGTFLPALCHVFMDTNAPLDVLESAARAITYFLDVHVDSTARKVVEVPGAVKAFCRALVIFPLDSSAADPESMRLSRDVSEQSVKVLELLCRREAKVVFEAEGLQCLLAFVSANASTLHKDTLQCSLSVASMLCGRLKPDHAALPECLASLTAFLHHKDTVVVDYALESLGSLVDMFTRAGAELTPMNECGLVKGLVRLLMARDEVEAGDQDVSFRTLNVVSLLLSLSHGSPSLAKDVLNEPILAAIQMVLQRQEDEKTVLAVLRLVDFVLTLVFRGFEGLKPINNREAAEESQGKDLGAIDAIRNKNMEALAEAVDAGANVNFFDHFGQTVLVWAAYTGTEEMAEYLITNGADANLGKNPPLHYAARFGRPEMVQLLLSHGADPSKVDAEGKTALDQARNASGAGKEGRYDEVVKLLEGAEESRAALKADAAAEEEEEEE